MKRYTVIVEVVAASQDHAFAWVEAAVEKRLEDGKFDQRGISANDGDLQVRTPDGAKSVVF